jgi:hypothetical protein
MSELKPCPFCGGIAYAEETLVRCLGCGIRTAEGNLQEKAIERWNRRSSGGLETVCPSCGFSPVKFGVPEKPDEKEELTEEAVKQFLFDRHWEAPIKNIPSLAAAIVERFRAQKGLYPKKKFVIQQNINPNVDEIHNCEIRRQGWNNCIDEWIKSGVGEIRLPEKKHEAGTWTRVTWCEGYNACIAETKRLNGIKE